MKKRSRVKKHPTVEKAHVCLFTGDFTISGDCTFVATKLNGEAIFQITMIKKI